VKSRPIVLLLCFLGFVALGLPDGLIGVAWPSIRSQFALPIDALGFLLIATTLGYVASSVASGVLLRWIGVGGSLTASTLLCGACLLGYAWAPTWPAIVAIGLFAGLGAGAIDSGINTFAAEMFSARTVNLLHAFYGIGTAAGPLLVTTALAAGDGWQTGYVRAAAAVVLLGIAFFATLRLWPGARASTTPERPATLVETAALAPVRLSMAVFFVYVGLEATAGAWLYSVLSEGRHVAMVIAGSSVSLYWFALFAGRAVYAFTPHAIEARAIVAPSISGAALGVAVLIADLGTVANTIAIATIGMCSGPIFPSLIASTPERVGVRHTANAVGLQVAISGIGLALIPALAGRLAKVLGLEALPIALLCGWLVLLGLYLLLERAVTTDVASAHPDATTQRAPRS
jgi:fucose permease